jgi:predicted alpha/beta-fold hydrolase
VPALLPARHPRGPWREVIVQVAPEAALRIDVAEPPLPRHGTIVIVHGIAGSSRSTYVRRMKAAALAAGWATVGVNCRNCGGTEALSRTLYNAGQSDDLGPVLAWLESEALPRPHVLVGFSLGGALALRYAGRAREACLADAVAAVNPPIDLEACCRALEHPANGLYHALFTLSLCRILQRIRRVRAVAGPYPSYARVRTLRRLDGWYTAPDAGYKSAEEYYREASAHPHVPQIRTRTLVLYADNDPFVPRAMFAPLRASAGNRVQFAATAQGGHLGFWSARSPRFWAADAVLDFAGRHASAPR